jgi:hypothetical protein
MRRRYHKQLTERAAQGTVDKDNDRQATPEILPSSNALRAKH